MDTPEALTRELASPGPGPDTVSLAAYTAEQDFLVVFLQRDHYCTNCREQVQTVGDRYEEFRARDAEVVSILPEPVERAQTWQERYDPPFPLLADPAATVGDSVDQPVKFGPVGDWSDLLGRMPAVAIVDARPSPPALAWVHRGSSTFDRPAVDDLLERLDALAADAPAEPA